jgi:hypothetical protein
MIQDLKYLFRSSFIGCEQGVSIFEMYNTKSLYLMLLKFYHHLHVFAKNGNGFTNKGIDENCNQNIFEMIASINEL